jgi:oligopeptide transport system permease protein
MPSFVLRRVLLIIPTLFIVVTLSFFLMRMAPGSPFQTGRKLPPAIEKNVMKRFGMDKPLGVQYLNYLGGVGRGDFGPSLKYRDKTVGQMIAEGFPKSLLLGLTSLVLATIVGIGLGVLAALFQNKPPDYAVISLAVLGICVPTFVTAPLLALLLGSKLGLLPIAGWGQPQDLVMPIIVLTLPQVAIIARLTRAGMIETLRSNFVRTARAKGLSSWRIVTRHTLPAALLPLVSYLGPACAGLITGSLVVEQIFNIPGLGRYFVVSALQRDYTVVMGVVILYSALIMIMNLLADVLYAALDPRVTLK